MMRRFTPLLILPLLAACAGTAPIDARPNQTSDACGASGYQSLVGRPLAAASFPAGLDLRLINPGEAVTMDYRDTRLNVEVDARGTITRVRCG